MRQGVCQAQDFVDLASVTNQEIPPWAGWGIGSFPKKLESGNDALTERMREILKDIDTPATLWPAREFMATHELFKRPAHSIPAHSSRSGCGQSSHTDPPELAAHGPRESGGWRLDDGVHRDATGLGSISHPVRERSWRLLDFVCRPPLEMEGFGRARGDA